MNRTIYDISADLAALESILAETGGDLSDPQAEAALAEWERELESDLTGKVDRYCSLIAEIEARSAMRQAEADRLADLAKADDKAAQGLRERLRFIWETRNLPKIETARFRVALTRNGGKAPLDVHGDVPPEFTKTKTIVEPDREKIRTALEAGERLSFALLMERGTRISIK